MPARNSVDIDTSNLYALILFVATRQLFIPEIKGLRATDEMAVDENQERLTSNVGNVLHTFPAVC